MYTTVPVLKLVYLLISILVTLYTFLWCMGIRPSTSDISSLFIYFLLFWFLQLWRTVKVREILELKKFSTFSLLAFFLFRGMHFSCLMKLLSSWSLYLPHQVLHFEFSSFTIRHKSDESQWTQLITCLRSVWSVVFNEPKRTRPSAITTYANIRRWYRFFRFFAWFISFILDWKRSITLSFVQTSSPSPPTRYLKTLHTDNWY